MKNKKLADACDVVFTELAKDESYYYAWQSNIAVAFKDEIENRGYRFPDLHEAANEAAKTFLNLLISKRRE